ncbi:uncharacterized protein LOC143893566 [Temnothorax americanus]|uniref:uncharacterized protein LOC143893566 n=1 Tax=Temnothorax americanus TaxID=1964332 RepID=UPI0040685C47
MADKIKLLTQKRTSLKSQITTLTNLVENQKIDNATMKLRITRLTELYHAFEEQNDELAVLDPNDGHQTEFATIQERFYSLAGKIENILDAASTSDAGTGPSTEETRSDNTIVTIKKRRIKLPEAPLPTFDGKFENWLSYKNAFHSMIGSQTDLTDIDKLNYLKSTLIDEAANKLKIFTIDGINYSHAWDLLERSYEVKRVLISRHLSLIINLPTLEKETTSGLSKLADDTQQHVASLNALGVSVGPEMIVHVLEGKLPKGTLDRWEATLERDEFPKLDQMYEFLYKAAVCASKRKRSKLGESERSKGEPPFKKRRIGSTNQTFMSNTSRNCIACKTKRHPLYLCDKFKQLPVPKRIETVRNAKVCYNCLRSHRDSPCKFSNCTICQKRHNTLLHLERYATTSKPDASKSESNQSA